jgi:hypothetical protein
MREAAAVLMADRRVVGKVRSFVYDSLSRLFRGSQHRLWLQLFRAATDRKHE